MRLHLTVEPPDGDAIDVAVEVDRDAPARTLVAALAGAASPPVADATAAVVERTGARLAGSDDVGDADLVDGDLLRLERPGTDGSTVRWLADGDGGHGGVELVVVGGPLMGQRMALTPGEHVLGRGPGADVVLADRSLSRRHLQVTVDSDGVSVRDLGSSNGSYIEGVPLRGDRAIADGEAVEVGRSLVAFEPRAGAAGAARRTDGEGGIAFNRPPRVAIPSPAGVHELPAAPGGRHSPSLPLAASIIPVVVAGAMYALTGSPLVLMIGILGPAMAIFGYVEARRSSGRSGREERERFDAAVAETVAKVEALRNEEAAALRRRHPDAAAVLRRAEELDPTLWERRPADDDFLEVRLGLADRPSDVIGRVAPGGDGDARAAAQERLDATAVLRSVPICAPAAGLGFAGNRSRALALARWVLVQAAAHHSPAELSIALAVERAAAADWDWVKWLPHVRHGEQVAVGGGEAGALLDRLAATGGAETLLVVDGDLPLDRALVEDVMAGGTAVVWIGRAVRELPGAVRTIVELDDDVARLRLTRVGTGEVVEDAAADGVGREWAQRTARLLAPVRDVARRAGRETLPASVSLLELLRLDPSPGAISRAWAASSDGLAAPLGAAADGPFEIDPARSDGLRMLIAGMPGAGKSELLQSLVTGLAALHPPDRLAFLLVDYKGGAAFGDCVRLPHTAGLVTDLDAALAERARVSLLAELRRREGLLADAGARSLDELTARDPAGAPPTLMIVVDEFATLAREVPAFVDTMVDVAQRGRSLGLHLVLATQRPRGAVSDTIRANTNLRIAMRVADPAESQDVVDAPDAASIPAGLPGRAVALTGRRPDGRPELTPFQAAYASGRSSTAAQTAVSVAEFGLGTLGGHPARELSVVGRPGRTDVEAIVAAARGAAEDLGLPAPEPPWLPPLPATIDLRDLPAPPAPAAAAIGLTDDPGRRAQEPFVVDLARDGSALVFGASGSGKTTLLRSLATALARRLGPDELHIYALDYATRGLQPLTALPQCGAVIGADDDERSIRLLERLEHLAEERRRLLAQHAVGAVAELPERVPLILLLLDGYPAFAAAFERVRFGRDVATIQRLAADGRALGIHVVATADRRSGVPGGLAGVVQARVVLRLADDDDYAALGIPRAVAAGVKLTPGRGFTGDGVLLQTAVLGGDVAAERALIEQLAAAVGERHPGDRAPSVGTLPARVDASDLPAPAEPLTAVLGIGNDTLAPVAVDLRDDHFLVAGALRSGRSTTLATLARSLRAGSPDIELHLLAPRRSPLADMAGWTSVARGTDDCRAAADRLTVLLERPAGSPPAVVVVDDGAELSEVGALETLVRRGRDHGVRVLAAVETHAAQRAYGGWLRELRSGRCGLLLQPDVETDGELLGIKLPRGTGVLGAGRGYLVEAGRAELVQAGA